jgi:hypothetical protein
MDYLSTNTKQVYSLAGKDTCVNCSCYGWSCNTSNMKVCSRCKVLSYCSQICQLEHFNKTHMKTCKYIAGIKVKEKSIHTKKTCSNCKAARKLAPNEFADPNSGTYPCIFTDQLSPKLFSEKKNKETNQKQILLPKMPSLDLVSDIILFVDLGEISGKFTCQMEQCISVITHICLKLMYTTPECTSEMGPLLKDLAQMRGLCWYHVRDNGEKKHAFVNSLITALRMIDVTIKLKDLSKKYSDTDKENIVKWWVSLEIFVPILEILFIVNDAHSGHRISKRDEIMKSIQHLLDAASLRMPPHKELMETMCGGAVRQTCNACRADITVEDFVIHNENFRHTHGVLTLGLNGLQTSCRKCTSKVQEVSENCAPTVDDLGGLCHNCFKGCSGRPRCKYCQSKAYCSEECQTEDWEIHKMFCESIQKAEAEGEMGRRISKRESDSSAATWLRAAAVAADEFSKVHPEMYYGTADDHRDVLREHLEGSIIIKIPP